MKPAVGFARTADGGNVAYTASGTGYPLLDFFIGPNANVALEWDVPKQAAMMRELAEEFRYVRFEPRGLPNSDPAPDRKMTEYVLDDIDAVARAAGVERFALMTYGAYSEIALRYAVTRPGCVSHLILNNPMVRDLPWTSAESRMRETAALVAQAEVRGIDLATRQAETHVGPDADSAAIEALARVIRSNATAKGEACWEKVWELHHELDLSPFAPHVEARTVITSNSPFYEPMARELAAAIPRSLLAAGERSATHTSVTQSDRQSTARRLAAFVYGDARRSRASLADDARAAADGPATAESARPVEAAFRTILFTDVVASTPLLSQLRDAKTREVMRAHDAVMRRAVEAHAGRVIKTIGDAFMAEFGVPSNALHAAIDAQRGIREQFAGSDVPLRIRIGINAGEPVAEDGDLHGTAVVVAKRLEGEAASEGILVSDIVKQAVAGKEFDFDDHGLIALKGFDEPIRAWAVVWD